MIEGISISMTRIDLSRERIIVSVIGIECPIIKEHANNIIDLNFR